MNDYTRIARIIDFLAENHTDQPDLTSLASRLNLSPFHFHRLFSTWAGVTPKDFLQCLTLSHAKELLRRGETILETSLASGLSGSGRLHDLCVTLEAATPGEIKSGGAGFHIRYGFAETPFGTWLAAHNHRGICHISFVDSADHQKAFSDLQLDWPHATFIRDDSQAIQLARTVFTVASDEIERPTLRAFVRATPFQVRVWRALLLIPPGALTTYSRLAATVGNSRAARAVGSAVAGNPLAVLIPCHRVIRETGIINHYRWGQTRKRSLIAWESARSRTATQEPIHTRTRPPLTELLHSSACAK